MANNASSASLIEILNRQLQYWVVTIGLGSELKICVASREDSAIDGEVKDNTIWIYCQSKEKALAVLRHEYVDWLTVQAIRPYQQLTNLQRILINELFRHLQDQAYAEKEKVVEALLKLLSVNDGSQK